MPSRADTDSFDAFYATHYAPLAAQVAVYLGDRAEGEDVTQEAFCRAWRHWPQLAGGANPAGWVSTVAYRLAASRWRRLRTALRHRQRTRPQSVPPPDADHLDLSLDLSAALRTLPDAQRRAVVLHYLADLPVDEIAARERVPIGTVKSWLHRARTRLAAELTEEHREGASSDPR
ncbi:RNA polymerase sigma factor [Cryptosporangium phraense]|uniref:RNA polymerase sigma factor n=1 Tax=Cryptosporangium phraense TaxID=2593070 RepID=A0A545ATK2_9ACTN|nr:RNA polymerase sigma factor [Cryptosporangium phraense]TQS44657.1 RNA polymerase sigma factor [Cryptosporangium phraense]